MSYLRFALFSFVLFLLLPEAKSQMTDLTRIEYTYFPQKKSDNSFRRFRTFIHIPLKLDDNAYLIPGFEYRNVNFKLRDPLPFSTNGNERYQSFATTIGFTDMLNSEWRYAFKVGVKLASDFEGNPIASDIVYEAFAGVIKDKTKVDLTSSNKPWRLILGVSYSTIVGRPFPLPVVNYYREFQPKWSYTLGIPKTNLKHQFNNKHSLQAYVTLDGFFANIQNDINVPNVGVGENISMTTVLSGLGYEYSLTKNLFLYAYLGHTIINDIRLRDTNGKDVFTINSVNSFYGRTGIKFKI